MDNQNELSSPIQDTKNYEIDNHQYIYVSHPIIDSLSGWMKFIGIYTIIIGSITCLGIITAAIGVPLILAGIALTKAAKSIKLYKQYNSPHILNEVFIYINKYFKTQGIFIIIGIVLSIIYFIALLFILVMSFNGYYQIY